ncbi:NVEALA domain-containing protein [Bacteroides graminisolvens]|uniref:NVEALA domain-containing protein n=1 Tax=Bacteroides graminisolvens TaxID=477666 RepID=UPI0023F02839|nr:NVEALA domain-containing protein [Bacteroides graminisolvens]
MKKNILKVALVATFALIAGYTVYTSQKSVDLSALALDNVEALAGGSEIGPTPGGTSYGCGYGFSYGGIGVVRACESCTFQYFVSYISGTSSCRGN